MTRISSKSQNGPGRTSRTCAALLALGAFSLACAAPGELLHLDFNDTASLGSQPDPLPAAALHRDIRPSPDFPGAADFGTGGRAQVTEFRSPEGPFSVETRFRLHSYAPLTTRYISDVLNTSTWGSDSTQGFVLRVGGGYLYAPLPRDAYRSEEEWRNALGWYDDTRRASISRCIGEFVVGSHASPPAWKEVVTDRCLMLNEWIHMVGVWDGVGMRIYLNGHEATDQWRILGEDLRPRMDSVMPATVGARALEDFDSRHFNGIIDYVRVLDSAMAPKEVFHRYRLTLSPLERDRLCRGVVIPVLPAAGQRIRNGETFQVRVVVGEDCGTGGLPAFGPGDSLEVEFAKDPEFQSIFLRVVLTDTTFRLENDLLAGLQGHAGAFYWRARLLRNSGNGALAKGFFVQEGEWSASRPNFLDSIGTAAPVRPRSGLQPARMLLPAVGAVAFIPDQGLGRPALRTLNGKRVQGALERTAGGWLVRRPPESARSLLLVAWE